MKTYNYYIAFLCDLMVIDLPNLKYHYQDKYYDAYGIDVEPFELKPNAKATTVSNEHTIYIDLDKFKDDIDVYLSLAHEVCHCAQLQSMYDDELAKDIAPFEIIQKWKNELKHFDASDVVGYENQSIELDANAFPGGLVESYLMWKCTQIVIKCYLMNIKNTFVIIILNQK